MKNIGYYILKGLMWLLSRLPLKVHRALGRGLGAIALHVIRYRYTIVITNLSRSFPRARYAEVKDMARRFYRHFGELIGETVWFSGCTDRRRLHDAHVMEITNPEQLQEYYDGCPSVMVMYTHAGNWELLGGMDLYNYTSAPYPATQDNVVVVYRKMHSAVSDRILKESRIAPLEDKERFDGYVESKSLVRYVFSHRDEKKIYNINTDQRPYFKGSDTLKVHFMNQDCETMTAAATLARKFHMGVLFLSQKREEEGHYSLSYIPVCKDASQMTPQEIMDRYYALLEADLNAQPWNYLWSHKRWPNKTLSTNETK